MALPIGTSGSLAGGPIGQSLAPIAKALEPLANAFAKIYDVTKTLFPVIDTLGEKFKIIGTVLGGVVTSATVAADAVAKLGSAMLGLVAKANPVIAQQFTLALNDTLAVIGQALMPVLQVATQIVRMFGDSIASFSGTLGSALGEIASSLIPIFEVLFDVFARVMGVVAQVLKFVAPLIRIVAEGIRTIFDWIGQAVKYILGLIGIEIGDSPVKKGASVGAAVRSASTSDVESVLRKARESALSLGLGAANFSELTAKNTGELVIRMGSLADIMNRIFGVVKNVEEIMNIKKDMERLKREDKDFYTPNLEKARARRAFVDSALALAGLGSLDDIVKKGPMFSGPLSGERSRGDGPGVVPGGGGAVGGK